MEKRNPLQVSIQEAACKGKLFIIETITVFLV